MKYEKLITCGLLLANAVLISVAVSSVVKNNNEWESRGQGDLTAGVAVVMEQLGDQDVNVISVEDNDVEVVAEPYEDVQYEYQYGFTTEYVNVRKAPNTDSEIYTQYPFNACVYYRYYNEDWVEIVYYDNGIKSAYISSNYISDEEFNFETVEIPHYSGMKSWMSYKAITTKSSKQYKIEQLAQTGNYGIRTYKGRYLIAVGTGVTDKVGQYIDLVLDNGTVIHCIVGDIKDDSHTNSQNLITVASDCCSEFIVSTSNLPSEVRIHGNMSYAEDDWDSQVSEILIYDKNVFEE